MTRDRDPLRPEDLHDDPFRVFAEWFANAEAHAGQAYPESAVLSTLAPDGLPEGRVVLVKGVRDGAFVFYTNRQSAKGEALDAHPRAGLTFYWETLGRQVRIAGRVAPVPDEESDAYFRSRPRGSRIGAWASEQSRPLDTREALEARVQELTVKFGEGEIPRPSHWGGYALLPERMEFWQEGAFRLHDRFRYVRMGTGWERTRLYP